MNLGNNSSKINKAILEIYTFFKKNKINSKKNRIKAFNFFLNYFKINYLKNKNFKFFITKKKHAKNINFLISEIQKIKKISFVKSENEMNRLLSLFISPYKKQTNFTIKNMRIIEEACYYIKYDRNRKNILFKYKSKKNKFLISINLSKPEKLFNNDYIKKTNELKCPICIENVGWSGNSNKSSKENLIIKKIKLNKENWFLQFSPYEYFKNHMIVINELHEKMKLDEKVIIRFYDFVNKNSNYFIGSNAGLKYIGGSILSHDHYQAGKVNLPIMKAKSIHKINFKKSTIEILDWPSSTIKVKSNEIYELEKIYWYFLQKWEKCKIKNLNNKKNNGFSLIFKKIKNEYVIWITFRNNSISREKPLGIFHVHLKRQNIKKESMGLIEISGLAILPSRLKNELDEIIKLWNLKKYEEIKNSNSLAKHYQWICRYANKNKIINWKIIKQYLGETFEKCIKDCSVFENKKVFINYIEKHINFFN